MDCDDDDDDEDDDDDDDLAGLKPFSLRYVNLMEASERVDRGKFYISSRIIFKKTFMHMHTVFLFFYFFVVVVAFWVFSMTLHTDREPSSWRA